VLRRRGRLVALVGLVGLAAIPLGSAAHKTISPTGNAADLGTAIAGQAGLVTGASFVAIPPSGNPDAVSTTALAGFPTDGQSYAILSNGDATAASNPNTNVPDSPSGNDDQSAADGGGNIRGDSDFDVTILRLDLKVPAGANCLGFDFRFLTEEYPEFVGQKFNDAFIAELDTSDWTTSGSVISAPHDFAFDQNHNVISVNAAGAATVSATQAAGTTYDGATQLLHASTPVTPGSHSLYLSIFDAGDAVIDSSAFVDNLIAGETAGGTCESGVTLAGGPPAKSGAVTGTVLVKLPGTNTFVSLAPGTPIPNGTIIDATRGSVQLFGPGGAVVFSSGEFSVFNGFDTSHAPAAFGAVPRQKVVELRLLGGNFKACPKSIKGRSPAVEQAKPVRRLFGKGKGHFPYQGALRVGHRARHAVGDLRLLQRHPRQRQAGDRRRPRSRQAQDVQGQGREELLRPGAEETLELGSE
jgi:hypothetical protein